MQHHVCSCVDVHMHKHDERSAVHARKRKRRLSCGSKVEIARASAHVHGEFLTSRSGRTHRFSPKNG